MSSYSESHRGLVAIILLAVLAVLCSAGTLAAAQDQPAPKWDLFGGYSFFYPNSNLQGQNPGALVPLSIRQESNPRGAGSSLTYNFNRWLGLTADFSGHWGSGEGGLSRLDDSGFYNLSLGPKLTFRRAHFAPFIEALGGWHRLSSDAFGGDDRFGFIGGGGVDVPLSKHFGLRLIQANYVVSNHHFGPSQIVPTTKLGGIRLQSGMMFMWGGEHIATSPRAACSVQPMEVFAGELATATVNGSNFNTKRTVTYKWSGSGVKLGEPGASTQIDTTGLQSGSYQVTASLSDGSQNGIASCNATFAVKAPHAPLISCSPDPASVQMGRPSTITSNASSPDGRRLTYSYYTSAGNITGNSSTATLDSGGAQPGTITVTCNVSDDRSPPLTASSSTTVNLEPPPRPPDVSAIERRLALHSVYFATAKPTLENPDAGLLASQEKTLRTLASDFQTYLQSKPDARLTLEGHADPRGSVEYNQALSERRVARTKSFLMEQGVPAANIQTEAFGKQQNLTDTEVRNAVERNPELSTEDRRRVLNNMRTIILASNRRVDITLSNAGQASQESVRQYPFNAADSLTLIREEGSMKTAKPAAKGKFKPTAQR